MRKFKTLCILILSLMIVPVVFSQTSDFGISIDCFQGCKNGFVDVEQEIMLKFVLNNNFDYWISFGEEDRSQLSFSIEVEHSKLSNNGKETIFYSDSLRTPYYLKPKSTEEVYFPLKAYNNLDPNIRLGEWRITPKVDIGWQGAKYYGNPFTGEIVALRQEFRIPQTITGNILKFEAKKKEVEVEQPEKGFKIPTLKQWVSEPPYSYFTWILGLIIVGVVVYYLTQGRRR